MRIDLKTLLSVLVILITSCDEYKSQEKKNILKNEKENEFLTFKSGFFVDSVFLNNGKLSLWKRHFKSDYFELTSGFVVFDSLGNIDFESTYYPLINYNYIGDSTTEINIFLKRSAFNDKVGIFTGEIDLNFKLNDSTGFKTHSVNYGDTLKYKVNYDIRKKKYKCLIIDMKFEDSVEFSGTFFFLELPLEIDNTIRKVQVEYQRKYGLNNSHNFDN